MEQKRNLVFLGKKKERSEHGNRSDTNTDYLFQLLCFLKLHTYTRVQVLIDICGVDYPSRKQRFEVVYNLLSTRYNSRIRVQTSADEGKSATLKLPSGIHRESITLTTRFRDFTPYAFVEWDSPRIHHPALTIEKTFHPRFLT